MGDVDKIVGDSLRRERWARNWTQSFVCGQLGISIRTLSRAETGVKVSKPVLKKLCALYQIPLSKLYDGYGGGEQEAHHREPVDLIPESVAVALLVKNEFLADIQRETIYRYNDRIRKDGIMLRAEVEGILAEVISRKKDYSFADVVSCCMAVNQRTVGNIVSMVLL